MVGPGRCQKLVHNIKYRGPPLYKPSHDGYGGKPWGAFGASVLIDRFCTKCTIGI